MQRFEKIVFLLFALLFFLVPLILWPFTSEVFEFNKMVLTYTLTVLIAATWGVRMIVERKYIFRRTILDVPLLIFLGSQLISTILSIDPRTSFLGYYSRFNGGFLSTLSYSLLFWAFVSNVNPKGALKLIFVTFASATLVSIYGVLQHFGIDKDIWVQDVQNRIFSTLGQPNWLAAFMVVITPLTWALSISEKKRFWIYLSLSVLFFVTLLFTKSRSGLLGFAIADIVFWGFLIIKQKTKYLREVVIFNLLFLISFLIIGNPFRIAAVETQKPTGPALETGGTESGTIRKIVWKGAIELWKHYPVFGTGVETFAYSYYKERPVEHNLVSEWDFIYNKAHNEFLNMAANSGTVGLISYLFLIGASVYLFIRKSRFDLLAGYSGLIVTNFFGFSVVPTQIMLFLFPAFALVQGLDEGTKDGNKNPKIDSKQKWFVSVVMLFVVYLLFSIFRYWTSDTFYNKGKLGNIGEKQDIAAKELAKAVALIPAEPLYHNELAKSYTLLNNGEPALSESQKAIDLSPANVNLKRSRFSYLIMLSASDPNYLIEAGNVLIDAIEQAPTDAKLYYNLGLIHARTGQTDKALETLQKTIELKANYKDARLAYAFLLMEKKQNALAKEQLEYILKFIDPNDSLTIQTLETVK